MLALFVRTGHSHKQTHWVAGGVVAVSLSIQATPHHRTAISSLLLLLLLLVAPAAL